MGKAPAPATPDLAEMGGSGAGTSDACVSPGAIHLLGLLPRPYRELAADGTRTLVVVAELVREGLARWERWGSAEGWVLVRK